MKISVILPAILVIAVLCFTGGYILREDARVRTDRPTTTQKDGFRYQGPFVNVDTNDGVVHVGRRNLYELGWRDGYSGKSTQLDEYQRGYDAGKAARDN